MHPYTTDRPELPLVLKGVSFTARPGERIGVCGRTGSGKSSLSQALFRLRELDQGSITVDGVDLSTLGLADVRGRASTVITQECLVFSGTVRYNLDPFNTFTDEQVWDALDKAKLKARVSAMKDSILATVQDGGSTFSQGERQLLCLARVLLRRPKVVFCDEATSSVDLVTDKLVHEAIEVHLPNSTIIEVAHRLLSVATSSKILVMDYGKVAQFDTPQNLVKDKDGLFWQLVTANGPAVTQQLLNLISSKT